MKKIGKWISLFFVLAMCLSITACNQQQEKEATGVEITCYADFSNGSETAEEDGLIQTSTATVEEVTPESIANALTDWTGLAFTLESASVNDTTITVDWDMASTLIAGSDNASPKEGFSFYDEDSMRWFMMDSFYRTLTENIDAEEIYYTMDGGQELSFDALEPVNAFSMDTPNMGSPFYFAHADEKGDMDDEATQDNLDAETAQSNPDGQTEQENAEAASTESYIDPIPEPGVLVYSPGFTGLTSLEVNDAYHGGYYYADRTEDGLTTIVNCGFSTGSVDDDGSMDEYIARCAGFVSNTSVDNPDIEDIVYESYPAYILSWQASENGETRQWDALIITTDHYIYFYGFDTTPEHASEMSDTWQQVFDTVELTFPSES